MKAYVVKNDRNEYLHTYYCYEDECYEFGELNISKLFNDFEKADYYRGKAEDYQEERISNKYPRLFEYKDLGRKFKVVKVTMAEGDLEEENRMLKEFAFQEYKENRAGIPEEILKKDFQLEFMAFRRKNHGTILYV